MLKGNAPLPILLPFSFFLLLALSLWGGCATQIGDSGVESGHQEGEDEEGVEGSGIEGTSAEDQVEEGPPDDCPVSQHVDEVPGVSQEQGTLDYWLQTLGDTHDLDATLLTPSQIRSLNDSSGTHPLGTALSEEEQRQVHEGVEARLDYLRERLEKSEYVLRSGKPLTGEGMQGFHRPPRGLLKPTLHVASAEIPLRCGPLEEGFYKPTLELAFDRNNCTLIRPQELIEVFGTWPNGMRLARTRYALGWIPPNAALSTEITAAEQTRFSSGEFSRARALEALTLSSSDGATLKVEAGTLLIPKEDTSDRFFFATPGEALHESDPVPAAKVTTSARPLTRRALLEEAFRHLGEPYGWGGYQGGRDCSRFLLDTFSSFNVHLPRHSSDQAKAGSFHIDVGELKSEKERLLMIESAAEKGIVLLHFPGHIMLYLGQNTEGDLMALHSLAEFVTPCDKDILTRNEAGETLFKLHKISVTGLGLGRGSARSSFIERLSHITVIGQPPGVGLQGVATRRVPAPLPEEISPQACKDAKGAAIYFSPEVPSANKVLKIIVTGSQDPGSASLTLISPDGQRHTPNVRKYGGPPFSQVSTLEHPTEGKWKVIFGDGEDLLACSTLRVRRNPKPRAGDGSAVWKSRRSWNKHTENLYATFVEALFDYALEDDPTWSNLHTLLRDPNRNILYNHLGHEEETILKLQPDCADLPYYLRAYFAWKMKLPFGFRRCNRGRSKSAPTCDAAETNHLSGKGTNPVKSFSRFVNGNIRNTVHSGNGRTGPDDNETDYYPVPLTRETLRPGTLYADPYGHLLVVARWEPQTIDSYGVLVAADAQPDGTVGLKRFWRGTFLFSNDTKVAGAGFKAARPLVQRGGVLKPVPNESLKARKGFIPFSKDQYKGSMDDFYDTMDSLINPRPLDPFAMQTWLIDALGEAIQFRVISVHNGEKFIQRTKGKTVSMPKGKSIFQTIGPWEDFSTPSRDMRVLIALDTVVNFPEAVRRAPQRFGLTDTSTLDATLERLETFQREEMARRLYRYTRSDGAEQSFSLLDVADRRVALEMAYNPNDCIEIRWGATPKSAEMATCKRHAPREQREKMTKYRPWFSSRQRPIN